jgi:hypothetical protein
MNLKALTLKYMGWCPGVESAARFIPNRDIPPTRIVFAVLIIGSVSASSYLLSMEALVYLGFPTAPQLRSSNGNPKIVSFDDQPYLFLDVESESERQGELPTFHSSSLYSAKLGIDGSLGEASKILDLGDVYLSYEVLVTRDQRCLLVYSYSKPVTWEESSLFFTQSTDLMEWGTPSTISDKMTGSRLLEQVDGEIMLVCSDSYAVLDESNGISDVSPVPLAQMPDVSGLGGDVYCFLDKDQRLSVIGVKRLSHTLLEINVEGVLLSHLEGDSWTEPVYLTRMGANIRGEQPEIYYSRALDNYLLLIRDPDPRIDAYTSYMSSDLKSWRSPTPITHNDDDVNTETTIRNPDIVELKNGTLVLVYMGTTCDLSDYPDIKTVSQAIFVSTSSDGENWSPPVLINPIVDMGAAEKARQALRGNASIFVSAASTILFIVVLYKNPSVVLGR